MNHNSSTIKKGVPLIRTRISRLIFTMAGILTTAAGIFGAFKFQNDSLAFKTIVISLPVILFLIKELYRRLRLARIKRNRFSADAPYSWGISTGEEAVDCSSMRQGLSALRNRKRILLLIEKLGEEDHQAAVYDLLARELAERGSQIERFYSQGELRIFWNEAHPEGHSPEQLARAYGNFDLIIGGDARRTFHYGTGLLHPWAEDFKHWKKRIILTNVPVSAWDEREAGLSSVFAIVPFTMEGLSFIADYLQENATKSSFTFSEEPPLPDFGKMQNPVNELTEYYGANISRWIAAAAICSQVSWALSLRLCKKLDAGDPKLLTSGNILRMSRLPWFRIGEIPEDTRPWLLASLTAEQARELRAEVVQTIEENPPAAPSHAHNHFRMELAGHKLLLPGYPLRDVKNELYELRSLGYREDVTVNQWIEANKTILDWLVSRPMQRYVYREGSILLGWHSWPAIPLFLVFIGMITILPPSLPRPGQTSAPDTSLSEGHNSWENYQSSSREKTTHSTESLNSAGQPVQGQNGDGQTVSEFSEITGRVLSLDEPPITLPGARVRILNHETLTDQNGRFSIRVPSPFLDHETLATEKDGFFPSSVRVSGYGQVFKDVRLSAKEIHLRVFDVAKPEKWLEEVHVVGINIKIQDKGGGGFKITMGDQYSNNKEVSLTFSKKGYRYLEKSALLVAGEQTVFLQREDNRTIIGYVKDADSRVMIPNCNITLLPERKAFSSDLNGLFQLGIPPGDARTYFRLEVKKEGYEMKNEPDFTSGSTIEISKKPRWIRGIVRGSNSLPLRGAQVKFLDQATLTGENGAFEILAQSHFEGSVVACTFTYKGCETATMNLNVPSSGNIITLENCIQGYAVSGKVTDICGNSIDKVKVEIKCNGLIDIQYTKNDGSYSTTLQLPFGQTPECKISASKNGYWDEMIAGNGIRTQTIKLVPRKISGAVVIESDKPLGGARVSLTIPSTQSVTTDPDGEFSIEIPGSWNECKVSLKASKPGYHDKKLDVSLENKKMPPIILSEDRIILQGKVIGPKGEVYEGVKILYSVGNKTATLCTAGNNGAFKKDLLQPPVQDKLYTQLQNGYEVTLTAQLEGFSGKPVTWKKGEAPVKLVLNKNTPPPTPPATITIKGSVAEIIKPIQGIPGATLQFYSSTQGPPLASCTTDEFGYFSKKISSGVLLEQLNSNGEIKIVVKKNGYVTWEKTWKASDGELKVLMKRTNN